MTAYQGWVLAALLAFSLGPLGISLWLSSSVLAVVPRKRTRLLLGASALAALLLTGWYPGLRLLRRVESTPDRAVSAGEIILLAYLSLGALVGGSIVLFGRRRAAQPTIPPTLDADLGLGRELRSLHRSRRPLSPFPLLPWNQAYQVRQRDWEVPLDLGDRPFPAELEGFTILHLSDIHLGSYLEPEYFQAVREHVRRLEHDALVFTGDFLDRRAKVGCLAEWLRGFQARDETFAVLGNHDLLDHDVSGITAALRDAGVRLLGGEVSVVRRGGEGVAFAGLDYQNWWRPFPVAELRRKVPEGMVPVLVTHTPCIFPRAVEQGFSLVLCGHTHGGQVRLPGVGALFVPARYGRRYQMGLYHQGRSYLHVHPGIGGPPALRISCAPEITRLRLTAAR